MCFMSTLSKTVLTLLIGTATDFSSPPNQYGVRNVKIRQLHMSPQYEPMAHRWYTTYTKYEQGYVPIALLIHQELKPFLGRVWKADKYEQAVYNFIANEGLKVEVDAESVIL